MKQKKKSFIIFSFVSILCFLCRVPSSPSSSSSPRKTEEYYNNVKRQTRQGNAQKYQKREATVAIIIVLWASSSYFFFHFISIFLTRISNNKYNRERKDIFYSHYYSMYGTVRIFIFMLVNESFTLFNTQEVFIIVHLQHTLEEL